MGEGAYNAGPANARKKRRKKKREMRYRGNEPDFLLLRSAIVVSLVGWKTNKIKAR